MDGQLDRRVRRDPGAAGTPGDFCCIRYQGGARDKRVGLSQQGTRRWPGLGGGGIRVRAPR